MSTATGDTQNLGTQNINIGNGWLSEYSLSDIGEIIVYNGTLTEIDHSNIHNYLQKKWGIQ